MAKKLLIILSLVLFTGCTNPDLSFDSIGLLGENSDQNRGLPQLGTAGTAPEQRGQEKLGPSGGEGKTQPAQEEKPAPQKETVIKRGSPNLIQLDSEIGIPKDKGDFTLSFENVGIRYSATIENKLSIEGEIKNTSENEADISNFKIIVNLYDDNDKLLETSSTSPILSTLTSGASSPFKLEMSAVEGMAKYRLVGGY